MSVIQRVHKQTKRRLRHFAQVMGGQRLIRLTVVFLLMVSIFLPAFGELQTLSLYQLDAKTVKLIGPTNPNLDKKFSYNPQQNEWQFNKEGIVDTSSLPSGGGADGAAQALAQLKQQTGGAGSKDASLYSVNLPADPKKGITYFDNNTNLAFRLIPQFRMSHGMEHQGRLVYPFGNGGKLVYTAKSNGMKEDIVLSHNIGDSLDFRYQLALPDSLNAKILDTGAVGIFSADPALFGNIQFGSNADRQKVESARKTAVKDHLLFALPPPLIKQSGGNGGSASARFELNGTTLTVHASGLNQLEYPLSVDPSVVITSSSDFLSGGNNESNIDFPSGQINRGAITGGNIGNYYSSAYHSSWTTAANTFSTARYGLQSFAYNGYLYVVGGYDGSNRKNDVQCSAINSSDGSLGTWNTSANSFSTARQNFGLAIYNGYVYIVGGNPSGASNLNDTQYAPITGGSSCVGSFATSPNTFTNGRRNLAAAAANGYLYLLGGYDGTNYYNDIQIATINGDGSIGSWSTSGTTFPTTRAGLGVVIYNNYIYVLGGKNGSGYTNDVEYAPLNASNGAVGSFTATSTFTTARNFMSVAAYNGYIYLMGGQSGAGADQSDTQFASVKASGGLGSWQTTSSAFATARDSAGGAIYNGYAYIIGGQTGAGSAQGDTQYAPIDAVGQLTSYTTGGNTTTNARIGAASIAINGYIYIIGGSIGGTSVATVQKATLNSDGTVGTWAAGTAMGTATSYFGFAFYNGYMYVLGGINNTGSAITTVQYASFNSVGGALTWSTTTVLSNASAYHPAAAYNGYLFYIGGSAGTGVNTNIQAAQLTSTGTITGGWTQQTATLSQSRVHESAVAYNGYLYVIGGNNAGSTYYSSIEISPLTTVSPSSASAVVGTFSTSSNALNDNRAYAGAIVVGGYLYVVGGTTTGGTDLSTAEYALINTNGTLGTFMRSVAFSSSERDMGITAAYGKIYLSVGTVGGANVKSTRYLNVNNAGWAGTGAYSSTTSLATQYASGIAYARSFAANGYLFIVGGYDGTTVKSAVYSAPINNDGSIGSWSSTSSLNTARYSFGLVALNGYVYVAGGNTGPSKTSSVEYASIGNNGSLGTWTASSNSLPANRTAFGMVSNGNYIYELGGSDGTTSYATTYYAKVPSAGGDLSSNAGCGSAWCSSTSFTTARANPMAAVYNNYIYVIAGDPGSGYLEDVQVASLNTSTGAIGSWSNTTPLPAGLIAGSAFATSGYLTVIAGYNSSGAFSQQIFAPILSNGNLGDWQVGGSYTTGRNNAAQTLYNGVLYLATGIATGTYYNDVQYAPLNIQPRIGRYSKLIDLGYPYGLGAITYNGSLPGGAASILVKNAAGTAIFGSSQASSAPTTSQCTPVNARYVWLSVTLDDSGQATFGDASGTISNVTDITVNYTQPHAPPNLRLFGGKYFNNQVLQPLDTCGP